ncbi:MAG: alpha/beta hydrolase [Bdellovibrionales bacterium]|nr:alpha/beta hydrolase [Bdellovibrionales bacterium]
MARAAINLFSPRDLSYLSHDGESQVFIRQYGSQKPKLHFILVHGALEYTERHIDLINFVLRNFGQDVAITTWDHTGHGRSGGARAYVGSFKVYVEDMNLVGEYAQKINSPETKTIILAHSMGGLISLTRILDTSYGWNFPLHGIVFSSPCIRPRLALGSSSEPLLDKLNKLSGKLHLPLIYTGKDITRDPERANDFDSNTLIPRFITVRMAKEVIEASHRIRGLSYYLRVPSLFLISGQDKVVDPESTALFAHGIEKRLTEIIHYPSHYHELWNEIDRFEIFETMKKWIEKTLKENS